jgi:hypothetical protein
MLVDPQWWYWPLGILTLIVTSIAVSAALSVPSWITIVPCNRKEEAVEHPLGFDSGVIRKNEIIAIGIDDEHPKCVVLFLQGMGHMRVVGNAESWFTKLKVDAPSRPAR